MADRPRYNFSVRSLLEAAGRRRRRIARESSPEQHTDHVVELQLVVAALNRLPEDTYWREDWERKLVDFFNEERNLQQLEEHRNQEKGAAVRRLIAGWQLTGEEQEWIQGIQDRWDNIEGELRGFNRFKVSLYEILYP